MRDEKRLAESYFDVVQECVRLEDVVNVQGFDIKVQRIVIVILVIMILLLLI
jgi:hypothetical protein